MVYSVAAPEVRELLLVARVILLGILDDQGSLRTELEMVDPEPVLASGS